MSSQFALLPYITKAERASLASSKQEGTDLSMEKTLVVFFFLHFFLLSSYAAFSKHASNGIDWWCRKTTYPETCKYFFNHGSKSVPKDMTEFKKMVIQFAMEKTLSAESHAKGVGSKCRNGKEKAAWADCLKLYQNTILQLNQTLDSSTKCTDFDIQTWLSTALTNLETCRTGFAELNVSDYVLPLIMSNNVTKLISNSLAINNASAGLGKETYKKGFPSWLSGGDRRLLQSSTTKVDLVVAQDGSGNHTTVGAALEEASLLVIEV